MQRLDDLVRRGNAAQAHRLALSSANLRGLGQRLGALDPLGVLKRGYAVLSSKDGKIVSSKGQVASGDDLRARVHDGEFEVRVTGLED
jgi:exodeoxyribonuclease VII large subunit